MTREAIIEKAKKVGVGAIMAGLGAGVVAALQFLQGLDFGSYTPFIVALASILINAARVYFLVPAHPQN